MTLYDWIKIYHKKTGEYPNSYPGSSFIFDEDRGFCVYIQDNDVLIVGEVCGNGRYWLNCLNDKARELGCSKLRFWTNRNPEAFSRKYGFMLTGFLNGNYIMEKVVR